MPKLSIDLVEKSHTFINALKDREIDLRDNKIPQIENLAVTRDQNDFVDLTNNDIRRVENFPLLPRLKCLLLSNNRISFIERSCAQNLPNLEALIANNNQLSQLGDIKALSSFKKLKYLSLLENPVTLQEHYRLFVIFTCSKLRMLDFTKVGQHERVAAERLFSGDEGQALHDEISAQIGTFEVGTLNQNTIKEVETLSSEEIERIKEAIKGAKTMEEVSRLERMLKSGRSIV